MFCIIGAANIEIWGWYIRGRKYNSNIYIASNNMRPWCSQISTFEVYLKDCPLGCLHHWKSSLGIGLTAAEMYDPMTDEMVLGLSVNACAFAAILTTDITLQSNCKLDTGLQLSGPLLSRHCSIYTIGFFFQCWVDNCDDLQLGFLLGQFNQFHLLYDYVSTFEALPTAEALPISDFFFLFVIVVICTVLP